MRKMALMLCLLLFFPLVNANAEVSGQKYETFAQYYKDNVSFINTNDSRHLLPLVLAKRDSENNDGRLVYELYGDVLGVYIVTDPTGEVIESCKITLTAPANMEYGSTIYNDFAISGYHSYALLMAMPTDTEPAQRYQLVTEVVQGMGASEDGSYSRQLGAYTLECRRDGGTATLSFQNNRALAIPETDTPEAADQLVIPDGGSPDESVNGEDVDGLL